MCVCTYVYIHMYIYTYIYMYICIQIYIYSVHETIKPRSNFSYMCTYVNTYIYTNSYEYIYIYININTHKRIYIYVRGAKRDSILPSSSFLKPLSFCARRHSSPPATTAVRSCVRIFIHIYLVCMYMYVCICRVLRDTIRHLPPPPLYVVMCAYCFI